MKHSYVAAMWWFLAFGSTHPAPPAFGPYPSKAMCEQARADTLKHNWQYMNVCDPEKEGTGAPHLDPRCMRDECDGNDCYTSASNCVEVKSRHK